MILEIASNEKIDKNHINSFITTNLKLKGINFNKKTRLIYSYVEPLSLYQILLFEDKIPKYLYHNAKYDEEIICEDKYIVIYKNREFYYIQNSSSNSSSGELINLLIKSLNLNNPKVLEKIEYKNRVLKNLIRPIKSHGLEVFVLYLLILGSCFYFYDYTNIKKEPTFKEISQVTKNIKDELCFYSISQKLLQLYKSAKRQNISISSIGLRQSILSFKIEAKSRDSIYKFLKDLNYKDMQNVDYKLTNRGYLANAKIKIFRR